MISNSCNPLLQGLKDISEELGSRNDFIQATGGNTSLKIDSTIWVKASGKSLKNSNSEEIFLPIDLEKASKIIRKNNEQDFSFKSINTSSLRPSIETAMHVIFPYKYVIHTHPLDVIVHSLINNSLNSLTKKLCDLAWAFVPYARPGYPLAKSIEAILKKKKISILILENHGLVVGGPSAQEAYNLHNEVVRRLIIHPRQYQSSDLTPLKSLLERLKTKGIPVKLPKSKIVHSLVNDSFSQGLALKNPLYPDHIVFCGRYPLLLNESQCLAMDPKSYELLPYLLVEGMGVILLGGSSDATEEMLETQAKINLRIPPSESVKTLSDSECSELENWEAEVYRRSLQKIASHAN